jgi:hypothetical protein
VDLKKMNKLILILREGGCIDSGILWMESDWRVSEAGQGSLPVEHDEYKPAPEKSTR